jgi:AraC family transcriptional activator FtrA
VHAVAVAVTDGTALFELATAYEIFGVDRGLADPWYDVVLCGPDNAEVGGWLRAGPQRGLGSLVTADTVIVPALRSVEEDLPAGLVDAVRDAYDAGARVVSLCTGAFVLAAAGLLDGRRATTHWAHTSLLAARFPGVLVDPDVLYVDEGRVLTSAGKAAATDLCLHIIRVDHGTAVANALARNLVVPPHRPGGQAQFIPAPVSHGRDHLLADLLPWAITRLDQPLSVQDLARRANMSSRNLARHFHAVTGTSPLRWLLIQRMHRAQELLETTDARIEMVAARTGMGTATSLRRHFNRMFGVTPEAYRRTFRGERRRVVAPREAEPQRYGRQSP